MKSDDVTMKLHLLLSDLDMFYSFTAEMVGGNYSVPKTRH